MSLISQISIFDLRMMEAETILKMHFKNNSNIILLFRFFEKRTKRSSNCYCFRKNEKFDRVSLFIKKRTFFFMGSDPYSNILINLLYTFY